MSQNTGNEFQSQNLFTKAESLDQPSSSSGFSLNLDLIGSFQELYNSINKFSLKSDWNFIRNDNEVVIYKVKSASVEVPKLTVIIKITPDLNIDVWVEEVAVDVKSSLWKLLGYNFEDDKVILRYSMLLDLIRFLDVNQLLVTNRKKKWQLNQDDVNKAIKGDEHYCRICYKTLNETQAKEVDVDMINFVNEITQTCWIFDESLSKLICMTCDKDLEEMKRFRDYLQETQMLLESTFKSHLNEDESNTKEGEQLILIRAQYDTAYVNPPQIIEPEAPLKAEVSYEEEWLMEDETEEMDSVNTVKVYDEIEHQEDIEYETPVTNPTKISTQSNKPPRKSTILKTPTQLPNPQGRFECPECPKTYPTRPAINKHIYRVHSPATETCPICQKVFNPYKLQCHMHFHTLQHKCEICGKSFPHPSSLASHMKKQHSDTPVSFPCSLCGSDLATKKLLNSHLTETHGYIEENSNKAPVECDYCGKQYQSKSSITNHFRRGCDQNPYSIKAETLQCRICNLQVASSSELTNHMRDHTTRYVCDFCKARFTHKVHYQRHMERHTNQSRPYQCDTCGASYSRIEHVKAHIVRAHTKDFKKKCQFCHKGFISVNELRDHERIHTNERPFICTFTGCLNTFRTKSALKTHLIRHTNYYYPCKYCFKKFRNMNNLVSHCKKVHQNDYKSDDELDFVPVVTNNEQNEMEKDKIVEIVFMSSNEGEEVEDNL